MNKCPVCNEEIDNCIHYMLALDKPYVNIFFHKNCYETITDITSFLNENLEDILYDLRSMKSKK